MSQQKPTHSIRFAANGEAIIHNFDRRRGPKNPRPAIQSNSTPKTK